MLQFNSSRQDVWNRAVPFWQDLLNLLKLCAVRATLKLSRLGQAGEFARRELSNSYDPGSTKASRFQRGCVIQRPRLISGTFRHTFGHKPSPGPPFDPHKDITMKTAGLVIARHPHEMEGCLRDGDQAATDRFDRSAPLDPSKAPR